MLDLRKAENICANHQYLIGERFNPNEEGDATVIESLTIAPYDPISKYSFLLDYKQTNNIEKALSFYEGTLYDVILLARMSTNIEVVVFKELKSYLSEVGREVML